MPTDVQRATTDLRQHPHAQFFRDNPTFEQVRPELTGSTIMMTAEKRHAPSMEDKRAIIKQKLDEARDLVNHPPHCTSDPSGVECIQITRHRNFNIGNAIKYLFRAGLKESANQSPLDKQIEDLRKAVFYINDEINRLEATR